MELKMETKREIRTALVGRTIMSVQTEGDTGETRRIVLHLMDRKRERSTVTIEATAWQALAVSA